MTLIICDPIYKRHLTGPIHPESPARYDVVIQALEKAGLKKKANTAIPRSASFDEISLCHSPAYIDIVKGDISLSEAFGVIDGTFMLSTGDVQICPDSLPAALKAAGAVITGVDNLMQNNMKRVFCAVRPPGHHACTSQGMGFCIFNNVAIGARYAQSIYGIKRVLIADWDVHHGNGTEEIFYEDPSVFYFSTHQEGLYPGTGASEDSGKGAGKGYTLNCPIRAGSNSRTEVLTSFKQMLVPAMEIFKPELILISAGFDSRIGDPLGGFNLTDEDFEQLTLVMCDLAEKYSQGRIISVLEGGYNLKGLASAVVAHVRALE